MAKAKKVEKPKKPAAKKCTEHVLENPKVIRLTHAIYEQGECVNCGVKGQYVTRGNPEKKGVGMSEVISKKKMAEILSPKNKDEKQKRRFVEDMRDRKVDIRDRYGKR